MGLFFCFISENVNFGIIVKKNLSVWSRRGFDLSIVYVKKNEEFELISSLI